MNPHEHNDFRRRMAIDAAKKKFDEGYDYVVGLINRYGEVYPWFFTSKEELEDLTIEPKYPLTKFVLNLAKRYRHKKIALVSRGCDERAMKKLDEVHLLDKNYKKVELIRIYCTPEEALRCNCEKPIYNTEKCVGCFECVKKCEEEAIKITNPCPVVVPNEFDLELGDRKAIYVPFPQAVPLKYLRDPEHCLKLTGKLDCVGCQEICDAKAVLEEDKEKEIELDVGSIVVATGFDLYDASQKPEYGYETFDNVITGIEFERLCSASGPTGGHIEVNGKEPKKVVFIQCVGSRDKEGNQYCSRVCCMYTAKQAHLVNEKLSGAKTTIYYTDVRAFGKGYEEFYNRVQDEGVDYRRRELEDKIEVVEENGKTIVRAENHPDVEADLVVLATAIVPRADVSDIVKKLRISQSADGFLFEAHPKLQPLDSFTTGIFLAGCAQGPKDIPDTVAQASGAASRACSVISKDHLDVSAEVAQIDSDKCTACLTCVRVCPYHVPLIDPEEGVAVIEAAKCQGCGTCAGECPAKAIELKHYLDEQIIVKCDALLGAYNSG